MSATASQQTLARGPGPSTDSPVPAVIAAGLRKTYGDRVAVDGIDFLVEPGTCFGFLGANGAGKSTTMKMIYGLSTIGGGALMVLGLDAARQRRQIKQRLGVVPQETNLDGELTVRENLLVHGAYFGVEGERAEARTRELLDFALLTERADERIWSLSGGMRRRLLVARALINSPELVVLDEPTTGLDPQARIAVWRELDRLKAEGVTLLITTHYMEEAARLCDRLVIMDEGRIVTEGEPQELVLEHVGKEVLELSLSISADSSALIETLGARLGGHELAENSMLLFGDNAEDLLGAVDADRFPHQSALARRATLEDVFLRLTGRSLRE